jgi:hypothetical protein
MCCILLSLFCCVVLFLIDMVLPDLRLDWLQGLVPALQIVGDDGEH